MRRIIVVRPPPPRRARPRRVQIGEGAESSATACSSPPILRDDAIVDIDIVATLHATMPRMIIPPPAPDEVRYLRLLIVHPRLPSSQFHPQSSPSVNLDVGGNAVCVRESASYSTILIPTRQHV